MNDKMSASVEYEVREFGKLLRDQGRFLCQSANDGRLSLTEALRAARDTQDATVRLLRVLEDARHE